MSDDKVYCKDCEFREYLDYCGTELEELKKEYYAPNCYVFTRVTCSTRNRNNDCPYFKQKKKFFKRKKK